MVAREAALDAAMSSLLPAEEAAGAAHEAFRERIAEQVRAAPPPPCCGPAVA